MKTTKILGGSLLVALMALGVATKVNTNANELEVRDVLTAETGRSLSGKVVRRANEVAEHKISDVKAQVSEEVEGKRHIRFVAGLDSVAYADVHFDIVAKDGDTVVKTFEDKKVTVAYTHVEAAGEVLAAADVFGAEYNYLVAYTINNVPEIAWGYTFEVTASVKTAEDSEYTTSEVATKVINNIVDADELVEPALPTSLAFGAATAEERAYLHKEAMSGTVENNRRWADNNAYFIYKFNLGKAITSLKLDLVVENDTKIEVSYDGVTYVEFANSLTENANGCGRYFGNVTNSFNVPVTENTGVVYLRFTDAKTDDGFGCCLYSVAMSWVFDENAETPVEPALPTSLAFGAATAEERAYLHKEAMSGTVENNRRWADNNAYFIYKFNLGKAITSLKLDLVVENDTKIEVSYDGVTYVEFANSLTENANGCGRYFGNVTNSFNVPVTENTGVVYLRFTDAKTDDGFGCCLYSVAMSWVFDENAETPVEPALPTSLAFGAATAEEREYLHEEAMSGTVENDRRWADQSAYFIYKFNLGKAITSLKLDLVVENDTKIEVSYDGVTYVEFANSLTENANGCGRYFGNVTNSFNVPVVENTGVVYLRFSDAKTDDGFGCCLRSVDMSWTF